MSCGVRHGSGAVQSASTGQSPSHVSPVSTLLLPQAGATVDADAPPVAALVDDIGTVLAAVPAVPSLCGAVLVAVESAVPPAPAACCDPRLSPEAPAVPLTESSLDEASVWLARGVPASLSSELIAKQRSP